MAFTLTVSSVSADVLVAPEPTQTLANVTSVSADVLVVQPLTSPAAHILVPDDFAGAVRVAVPGSVVSYKIRYQ